MSYEQAVGGSSIYRRWKIIYAIRAENIIVGRVWPAVRGRSRPPYVPIIESMG